MGTPEEGYRALFARQSGLPGWSDARSEALRDLAFPVRSEAWRFTPARKLLGEVVEPGRGARGALPDAPGITVRRLTPNVEENEPTNQLLRRCLATVAPRDGFFALNLGFFREVAVAWVPAGTTADVKPTTFSHNGLSTPRILVVAEAGSRVDVAVQHTRGAGLAVPVVEIVAEAGAHVSFTQTFVGGGDLVGAVAVRADAGSSVAVQSFVFADAGTARIELTSALSAGATLSAAGLVLARGSAHVDQHLHLTHAGNSSTTRQMFRNILDGSSRAVFTGQVDVAVGVTGSDAGQSVSSLLLADGPSVVTRPWLEIHNDDVKASHGATVGRLDPEALFYLRARGIGVQEASRLLTRAFAGEVTDTVPETFREAVKARVDTWLEGA